MKKGFIIFALLTIAQFSFAQKAQVDELQILQSIFGMSKKDLISNYIKPSSDKETEFWATYDKFELERQSISRQRFTTINDYATNYFNLNDIKADQLATEILANNLHLEQLNKKYYAKFKKIVGGLNAAKLIQLEVFIQSQIKSTLQNNIPFIGEIKNK